MEFDISRVIMHLNQTSCPIDQLQAPQESGVYALFACNLGSIGGFPVGENGLIYIGISKNLAAREFEQHFSSKGTGFSTVRRSFGAILKKQLKLTAIPRSPGSKPSSYRFVSDGEDRLTNWMKTNLEISVCRIENAAVVETKLINKLKPTLNLTKWTNPWGKDIKRLRKDCANEAQAGVGVH